MKIDKEPIKSFADLHNKIESYGSKTMIYRGLKSVDFELKPSIGRIEKPPSSRSEETNEKEILRLFKEKITALSGFFPRNKLGLVGIRAAPWFTYKANGLDSEPVSCLLLCGRGRM